MLIDLSAFNQGPYAVKNTPTLRNDKSSFIWKLDTMERTGAIIPHLMHRAARNSDWTINRLTVSMTSDQELA